jgi:antitoxin component YwqK of YwqJK toxin-antitoxin module
LKQLAFILNRTFVNKIITYADNGKLYREDSLLGPCQYPRSCDEIQFFYNENGTLSQIYTIKNGVCEGNTKQFDHNGTLIKSYNLVHDSVKNGEYLEFFNTGKVSFRAEYKNDTMVGIGYVFKENGDSSRWFKFFKGQNDFPTKVWLDNGNTQIGDYLDDKKTAVIWKWYDKEGHEIRKQIEYSKNGSFIRPN